MKQITSSIIAMTTQAFALLSVSRWFGVENMMGYSLSTL